MYTDKFASHMNRLERAASTDAALDFGLQLMGVYSTVSVLEVAECLSGKGMVRYSLDELSNRYQDLVPFGNLAYVIRIHDFHRQGVSFSDSENGVRMYGPGTLTVRGPGSSASLVLSPEGAIAKTAKRNGHVKVDRLLLQSGWRFRTEDMADWVGIHDANKSNWSGARSFVDWVLSPRNA